MTFAMIYNNKNKILIILIKLLDMMLINHNIIITS